MAIGTSTGKGLHVSGGDMCLFVCSCESVWLFLHSTRVWSIPYSIILIFPSINFRKLLKMHSGIFFLVKVKSLFSALSV